MILDAHSHLTLETLQEVEGRGIDGWVLGGIEPAEWQRQLEMAEVFPGKVFPAFGVHPWWVHTATPTEVDQALEKLETELPKAYALGETGLDGFKQRVASLALQKKAFEAQVKLAERLKKPLVLHIVQAHAEAQKQLVGTYTGIIHSFSGKEADARAYIERGFLISVSGTILRKGYEGLKAAVRALPLENFVIETDSEPPFHLYKVAEAVAELKGISKVEVLEVTTKNVQKVFGI